MFFKPPAVCAVGDLQHFFLGPDDYSQMMGPLVPIFYTLRILQPPACGP